MSDAPMRSNTSSSTTRIMAWVGESVTDANERRRYWFHICRPEYNIKLNLPGVTTD
jgi:hypothetical protein